MSAGLLLVVLVAAMLLVWLWPRWRRQRLLTKPVAADWLALLDTRLPVFARLQADEQRQLLDLVRLFLAEKKFHGCAGQQITDEVRVLIAAQACLLLLNRRTAVFPRLQHILVYPAAFTKEQEELNEDGTVSLVQTDMLGESWHYGKVILSWDDIEYGLANFGDGENVVLHEFAHQLDAESGSEDGTPPLRHNDSRVWAAVMQREFAALTRAAENEEETVMDPYGASDPVEFFAVATETFFELPALMYDWHPQLFAELQRFYCVDPRAWQP